MYLYIRILFTLIFDWSFIHYTLFQFSIYFIPGLVNNFNVILFLVIISFIIINFIIITFPAYYSFYFYPFFSDFKSNIKG